MVKTWATSLWWMLCISFCLLIWYFAIGFGCVLSIIVVCLKLLQWCWPSVTYDILILLLLVAFMLSQFFFAIFYVFILQFKFLKSENVFFFLIFSSFLMVSELRLFFFCFVISLYFVIFRHWCGCAWCPCLTLSRALPVSGSFKRNKNQWFHIYILILGRIVFIYCGLFLRSFVHLFWI